MTKSLGNHGRERPSATLNVNRTSEAVQEPPSPMSSFFVEDRFFEGMEGTDEKRAVWRHGVESIWSKKNLTRGGHQIKVLQARSTRGRGIRRARSARRRRARRRSSSLQSVFVPRSYYLKNLTMIRTLIRDHEDLLSVSAVCKPWSFHK